MRSSRRGLRIASAIVTLALAATACGGDDGNGSGATGEKDDQEFKLEGTKGGTLKIVGNGDTDYLDPQRTYYAPGFAIQRALQRQLLTYKAAPADAGGYDVVPDLAKAMPTISEDGLTYTFELKDGIKYDDGSPIVAADIKYAVERSFEVDTLSGGPQFMSEVLEGGATYKGIYKDPKGLSSITVEGDKKITFKLADPYADFIYVVALPTTTPVPKAKDTRDKYNIKPISSGPYKLASYKPEKEIIMERNPHWDPATDEVRKAFVDRIEMTLGVDTADITNRIEAGDADLSFDTSLEPQDIARVKSDPTLLAQTNDVATGCTRYLSMNTEVAPFDKLEVRQAMQYAVNKETYRTARGGPTAGDFADGMLPPFGQDEIDLYKAPPVGDPAKARELFAKAGYTGGKVLMLATNAGKGLASAQAVQAALKPYGMEVELKQVAPGVYFTELGTPSKKYAMGIAGWCADWPGPSTYIGPLFHGKKITPNGNKNYSMLNDPEINAAIDEANKTADVDEANEKWYALDKMIMERAPIVPLLHDRQFSIHSARLKNAFVHPAWSHEDYPNIAVQ